MRGLFTGVGPRVGRAGPSVGIVVSFYEVVKYALHHQRSTSWLTWSQTVHSVRLDLQLDDDDDDDGGEE